MSSVNWNELKIEYITTDISYRKMSAKYGIPMNTIVHAAKTAEWTKERKRYREKVVSKTLRKVSELESNKLAKLVRVSDNLDELIEQVMEAKKEELSTQDVRNLALTIKDAISIKRNVYHLPTLSEAETFEIARERLALDRKKWEAEKEEAEPIEIILSAEGVDFSG